MAAEEVSESRVPLIGKEKPPATSRGGVYVILCVSLVVNFVFIVWVGIWGKAPLAWPAEAVRDAELAAMARCSGHGDVFVDTIEVDEHGNPVCECHECFTGPDCSIATVDCVANADV